MELTPCWQCGTPNNDLFCPTCNALQQPPREYFKILGLPHKLSVDPAELQKHFYELSRKLHPDRFTQRPPAERENSLQATAILNDAYRTLKDPVARAEYVLRENGFDIGEQRSKDVPPELLEEVFELNMALEEARSGDESARPQLQEAQDRFGAMLESIDGEIQSLFARYDAGHDRQAMQDLRTVLNRRRYIRNLVRDVELALA